MSASALPFAALRLVASVSAPQAFVETAQAGQQLGTLRMSGEDTPGLTYESEAGVRLEIAVSESFVKPTLDALYRATGEEDGARGTVYVLPLKDAIRIRTGERGPEAI